MFKPTFESELKISVRTTEVFTKSYEKTEKLASSPDHRRSVLWVLVDRYTIERMDGSLLSVSEIIFKDFHVHNIFTQKSTLEEGGNMEAYNLEK